MRRFNASTALFISLLLPVLGYGQQEIFYLEDFDTTPVEPDELRGWKFPGGFEGQLEWGGIEYGNYLASEFICCLPVMGLTTHLPESGSDWLMNPYVGDKNYKDLEISRIDVELFRNDLPDWIQHGEGPISLILARKPENPDDIPPQIWYVGNQDLLRGGEWQNFTFEISFHADALPPGWGAYPDTPGTWNYVLESVDRLSFCLCHYGIGIGGIPGAWDIGVDNLTIYKGRGDEAESIPLLNNFGMILLGSALMLAGMTIMWARGR